MHYLVIYILLGIYLHLHTLNILYYYYYALIVCILYEHVYTLSGSL